MLTGLAVIILSGILLGTLSTKLRLPSLVGMIISGIILGTLKLLPQTVLDLSSQLRQFALVVILTRSGLSLNIADLKKVGRVAFLLCFIPACFEIVGCTLIAPKLLGISTMDAAVIGSVIAAVSPAVVVPRMIKLINEKRGTAKGVPQMIMAGASVDDVFVIVVFTALCALSGGSSLSVGTIINVPVSIGIGVLVGILSGGILYLLFTKGTQRPVVRLGINLSVSFLLLELQTAIESHIPFSALISVMTIGITVKRLAPNIADELSKGYNSLWTIGEVILFVLVGAAVNISYALRFGIAAIAVVIFSLIFRMLGTALCTVKTSLNLKERLFTMLSYTPKATVQAAIGSIPLSLGLSCGEAALTTAVLSILITAPIGAALIDNSCNKLLSDDR
jgi:NhaP-type Na+/H+ or K+/H+ antiporter